MSERTRTAEQIAYALMISCWAAHLILVWLYRYVPSVDYPEWLLQASILAHYTDPAYAFGRWYAIVLSPVPNGGFVLPGALLAKVLPIEVSGKVLVSAYVLWFPISVRSFLRAVKGPPMAWLAAIPLLFTMAFVHGNFAYLIGTCLLFTTIGVVERAKPAGRTLPSVLQLLLTIVTFLAHAIPAAALALYFAISLTEPASKRGGGKVAIAGVALLLLLGFLYYVTRPAEQMMQRFVWGLDARYTLSVIAKSFTAGITFPPYEFSVVRLVANIVLLGLVALLFLMGVRGVFRTDNRSLAWLVVILAAVSALAPKLVLGIGELSGRLALVVFLLALGLASLNRRQEKLLTVCLVSATLLVTVVRWNDYAAVHQKVMRRSEFLQRHIHRNAVVETLNDSLAGGGIPFWHLTPKGLHFIFQTNYVLLDGGFNPLSFRTGYIVPRPGYDTVWKSLVQRATRKDSSYLGVADIPSWVDYLVLDTSSPWGEKTAHEMRPAFEQVGRIEIVRGLSTIVLKRVQ